MLTLARQPSGSGSGGNGNVIYDDVIIRQKNMSIILFFTNYRITNKFLLSRASYSKCKIFHHYDLVNSWLH